MFSSTGEKRSSEDMPCLSPRRMALLRKGVEIANLKGALLLSSCGAVIPSCTLRSFPGAASGAAAIAAVVTSACC